MSLIFCEGDIFAAPPSTYLAHGCNCRGVMGAGVAAEIKRRFPRVHSLYREQCKLGVRPGSCFVVTEDGRTVYNLFSQVEPGADATEVLIALSVRSMLDFIADELDAEGIMRTATVVMPLIGFGIGGVGIEEAEGAIEAAYGSSRYHSIDLYVASDYVPGVDPLLAREA